MNSNNNEISLVSLDINQDRLNDLIIKKKRSINDLLIQNINYETNKLSTEDNFTLRSINIEPKPKPNTYDLAMNDCKKTFSVYNEDDDLGHKLTVNEMMYNKFINIRPPSEDDGGDEGDIDQMIQNLLKRLEKQVDKTNSQRTKSNILLASNILISNDEDYIEDLELLKKCNRVLEEFQDIYNGLNHY